jgi:hypothetical protein
VTRTIGEAPTPDTVTAYEDSVFEPPEPAHPGLNINLLVGAYAISAEFRRELQERFPAGLIPGTEFTVEDISIIAAETTPVLSLPPSPVHSFRSISAGSVVSDTSRQADQERQEESLLSAPSLRRETRQIRPPTPY